MRFLRTGMMCLFLVLPLSAVAFDGEWGEPPPEAYDPWPDFDPWASTSRDTSDLWRNELPYGHEEHARRAYENQQERTRQAACDTFANNNPAAKEACWRSLGR